MTVALGGRERIRPLAMHVCPKSIKVCLRSESYPAFFEV